MFHKLGLAVITHVDPYIQLTRNKSSSLPVSAVDCSECSSLRTIGSGCEFQIVIGAPVPSVDLNPKLTFVDEERHELTSFDEYILQQSREHRCRLHDQQNTSGEPEARIKFFVRLPKHGIYRLEIYAVLSSPIDASKSIDDDDYMSSSTMSDAPVYNYVIDHRGDDAASPEKSGREFEGMSSSSVVLKRPSSSSGTVPTLQPFPRQSDLWRSEGCVLLTPYDGKLLLRRKFLATSEDVVADQQYRPVVFRLKVPRADKVAVVVGGKHWHYLELWRNAAAAGDSIQNMNLWWGEVKIVTDDINTSMNNQPELNNHNNANRPMTIGVEICAHYPGGTASFRTLLEYTAYM